MKKYIIERNIPGIGGSTHDQLCGATRTSCNAIDEMEGRVHWVHSYVTGDKTYCIYLANNKEAIQEHAEKSGFPANSIEEVKAMIDPTT